MTDLFMGRSAAGGKRTTTARASKHAVVNENGRAGVMLREVGYIESAVHMLSIHSMFGWTTNFTLPLAGAEYSGQL